MEQRAFMRFGSGLELATVLATSDLLSKSWDAISALSREDNPSEPQSKPFSVRFKVYKKPKCHIIAFVSSSSPTGSTMDQLLQTEGDLVSLSELKEIYPDHFNFLGTKTHPSFSIHRAATTLFIPLHAQLSVLKNKMLNEMNVPLIITGHSLGGSIASLFTLWLLEDVDPLASKLPICITFGSQLLGDRNLQRVVLDHSRWNSCFLNVVSNKDPLPRLFAPKQTAAYYPFGTYLLCNSETGCACVVEADSILDLVNALSLDSSGNLGPDDSEINYKQIVESLQNRVIYGGMSLLGEQNVHPLRAGIVIQLDTIGVKHSHKVCHVNAFNGVVQQEAHGIDVSVLVKRAEELMAHNKRVSNPFKKLNESRINMARLEWYKKGAKAKGIGYYDTFKNLQSKPDHKVIGFKRSLTNYWKALVEEAEKKPQKEGVFFRKGWLYGGTNYRRMVEPLDIAEYYKRRGVKDYVNQGRSQHYVLLEKWLREDKTKDGIVQNNAGKAASLTEDSCFWARVEEALISCRILKSGKYGPDKQEASRKGLIEFEQYVMELIQSYALSPETFLGQSSFMKWWGEYEKVIESNYSSQLTIYMKDHKYDEYA